jgi:tripartite-type tricarboxylate transporter receptor subunit TctC
MQTSGPLIKAGKLKALAVASSRPSPHMPDVPTLSESGLPGFTFEPWFGILGPAGLPEGIVARLNAEITVVMADPEVLEAMKVQYLTPTPGTAAAFAETIRNDMAYWAASAQAAGVTPE